MNQGTPCGRSQNLSFSGWNFRNDSWRLKLQMHDMAWTPQNYVKTDPQLRCSVDFPQITEICERFIKSWWLSAEYEGDLKTLKHGIWFLCDDHCRCEKMFKEPKYCWYSFDSSMCQLRYENCKIYIIYYNYINLCLYFRHIYISIIFVFLL